MVYNDAVRYFSLSSMLIESESTPEEGHEDARQGGESNLPLFSTIKRTSLTKHSVRILL